MTKMQIPSNELEASLTERGFKLIAGIDEVGRGPLAGPVVAASVVLDPRRIPEGLNDSKKLSEKLREELFAEIVRTAHVGVAAATAGIIDRINIRQATLDAMKRSLRALPVATEFALVDGNDIPPHLGVDAISVVRGDARSVSIAAASIVAKVVRDRMMAHAGRCFPAYHFEAHKGYGTREHLAAIGAHGPCPMHRMSFSPFVQGELDFS